jgi:hypothetical protein
LLGFAALYPVYRECADWRDGEYLQSLSRGVTHG